VSNEEHHVALPKLYGAPAYARPPRLIEERPRPIDPDDLPIEAFRTGEDVELLQATRSDGGNGHGSNGLALAGRNGSGGGASIAMAPRPFSLKSLSRFLSGR
jgi:hypothetical protein